MYHPDLPYAKWKGWKNCLAIWRNRQWTPTPTAELHLTTVFVYVNSQYTEACTERMHFVHTWAMTEHKGNSQYPEKFHQKMHLLAPICKSSNGWRQQEDWFARKKEDRAIFRMEKGKESLQIFILVWKRHSFAWISEGRGRPLWSTGNFCTTVNGSTSTQAEIIVESCWVKVKLESWHH